MTVRAKLLKAAAAAACLLCVMMVSTGMTASAQVLPPTVAKSFAVTIIPLGIPTPVSFVVANPNAATVLTGVTFTDILPAGLSVASPNGLTGSCTSGSTGSVPTTPTQIQFNGTLAAGGSCSFSVNVVGTAIGTWTNSVTVQSATAGTGNTATATLTVGGAAFLTSYAANLNLGESFMNISNEGVNGAPLLGPGFGGAVGNICVNVYAFSPDEQLISCCSCLVTPNGLVNLGVTRDLTSKTLTGVIPTSVVVKLVSTLAGAGGAGTTCTNSAATATTGTLAAGVVAWRSTLHAGPPATGMAVTETPFSPGTLSAGELASLTGRCASILGNGSGFGICRSCQAGALGAGRQ